MNIAILVLLYYFQQLAHQVKILTNDSYYLSSCAVLCAGNIIKKGQENILLPQTQTPYWILRIST